MAKSRGRKFAEITSPASGVFDLTSVPTITNAKLQNSAMTLAGSSVSLGGTGVADTDALSEGSSNVYFTDARVQTFLGGGTLAGNVVVPDNRSIYLGSNSDFRMVHNTINTQLINGTGALQITSNGGFAVTGAATFSSTITSTGHAATGDIVVTKSSAKVEVTESSGASVRMLAGGATGYIGNYSNHSLQILTNSTPAITIDNSQNATFASAITALSAVITGASLKAHVGTDTGTQLNLFANSSGHCFIAGHTLSFNVGANNSRATKVLINADGEVGIGGTGNTLDELLHIEKSVGTTIVKTEVAANSTVGFEIKKTGSTTSNWRIVDGQTVNGDLEIYDVTDSRLVTSFNGAGNVKFTGSLGVNKAINAAVGLSVGADSTATNSYGLEVCNASANTRFLVDGVGNSYFYRSDNARGLTFEATSGNVGIGTARGGISPNATLHVAGENSGYSGTIRVGERAYLAHDDTSSTKTWIANNLNNDSATFGIRMKGIADSNQVLTVKGNGNVGIGTSSPTELLQVEGSIVVNVATGSGLGEEGIFFRSGFSNSNKYNTSILSYAHDGSGGFSDGISINGYDGLSFCTGSDSRQERMRIVGGTSSASGFVGIGTTAPASLLDLRKTTGGYITGGTGNTGPIITLHHEAQWESAYGTGGSTPDWLGGINFSTGDGSAGEGTKASIRATVDTYYNTNSLAFYTTAASGNTTLTERMRIQNNGNVAIGITTPTAKLTVDGQITGGFGGVTTAGTTDWNHSTNARSGMGYTLLLGTHTNGFGVGVYYHVMNYEYGSKNGNGNMTQLAIPYNGTQQYIRYRYTGNWSSWVAV